MTILFESEFDDPTFAEFDIENEFTTSSLVKLSGTYSGCQDAPATGISLLSKTYGGTETVVYASFWIRFDSMVTGVARNLVYIYDSEGGGTTMWLYVMDSGANTVFRIYNSSLGNSALGTTAIQNDTWYFVELRAELSATASLELWLDGTLECSLSGDTSAEGTKLDLIDVQPNGYGLRWDQVYFDKLIVSTTSSIYTGGPYLGTVTLGDYVATEGSGINPINLPFGRLNENITSILEKCSDTNYDTWEFWIDHDDGEVHFALRKGSDLSSSISFIKGTNIGDVGKEGDCRGCENRVKVIGKSEGKEQDEITSSWKVNILSLSTLTTFYEKILSDKQVSDKDTADVIANIYQKKNGPVEDTIEINVSNDTYAAMAYDIGDDVTVTHSSVNLTGVHRIKSLHKTITKVGEQIKLYVGTRWQDVSDELSNLKRLVRALATSGTVIQDWLAEGAKEGEIDSTKLTDVWEKNVENDKSEPPADKTDSNWNITGDGSWSQSLTCTENYFYAKGSKDTGNQRTLDAIVYNDEGNGIRFDQNPKFVVVVKILDEGIDPTTGATDWEEEDFCEIMLDNNDTGANWRGVGFYIVRRGGKYHLYYGIVDADGQNWNLATETTAGTSISIDTNTQLRLECRVKYDLGFAEFYYNNELIGIMLFGSGEDGTSTVYPVGIHLITSNPAASVQFWAQLYFYKWRTEWTWAE